MILCSNYKTENSKKAKSCENYKATLVNIKNSRLKTITVAMILFFIVTYFECKEVFGNKGNIQIKSEPTGAVVINKLTNVELGKTPFSEIKEVVGTYEYILKLEGFKDEEVIVNLKDPKQKEKVEIKLTDLKNVSITTIPEGAMIHGEGLDGKTTPFKIELKKGKHEFKISKKDYLDKILLIYISKDGEKIEKVIEMYKETEIAIKQEEDEKEKKEKEQELARMKIECESKGDKWTENDDCIKKEIEKPKGLVWDSSSNKSGMTWNNAMLYCQKQGKRLPTLNEMKANWKSLNDSGWHWTSTEKEDDPSKMYHFSIHNQVVDVSSKENDYEYVRCVR